MPKRHAILIAGMHRSGTSALARVVNLLGAEIGEGLLSPKFDNPRGYWEAEAVVALNDECLDHFGLSWDEPWPLPHGWLNEPWVHDWRRRVADYVTAQFDRMPLFAIKDPRLSCLLPAWLALLHELDIAPHVLISVRNPAEVVASMHTRSNMPPARTLLLWLTHTLEAERASRDAPRAFVHFEQLLRNPDVVVDRIQRRLDIVWPESVATAHADIGSFLDIQLRHHHAIRRTETDPSELERLATAVYNLATSESTGTEGDGEMVQSHEAAVTRQAWDAAHMKLDKDLDLLSDVLPAMQPQPPPAAHAVAAADQADSTSLWLPAEVAGAMVEARLYYRAIDRDHEEGDFVATIIATASQPLHAKFILPQGVGTDFIRLDPATRKGIYRILGVTINGHKLALADIKLSAVHERLLGNQHGEWLRFFSGDDDPYIELDIRALGPPGGGPLHVDFVFECDSLLDYLGREMERHEQALVAAVAPIKHQVAEIVAGLRRVEAAQQTAHEKAEAGRRRLQAQDHCKLLAQGWGIQGPLHAPMWRLHLPGQAMHLRPRPSQQLQCLAQPPASRMVRWRDEGGDPYFQLEIPGARPLASGWYVLNMDFCGADGSVLRPALYVDYGDGFDEASRIDLLPSPGTRQRLLLHFSQQVHGLRFDPHDADGGEFLLSPMRLRRITRMETLLRLGMPSILRMRSLGHGWGAVWREGVRMLKSGGVSASVDALYANQETPRHNSDYQAWIAACDTLTDDDRAAIRAQIKPMADPPLISILLPTYNTPEPLLRACLDSVLEQLYPHWELCIADDASSVPHVRQILEAYAARDPRIKLVFRETNGHISAASNSALELATGDWVALLDHDDLLPEHALFHVVEAIVAHPDAGLIYSDEDKINDNGHRYDPYFKPDWNPELFLAQNMISHLGAYQRKMVLAVGGFREGYEGSQDHDLALRCIERIDASKIVHIPRVLYHWRAADGSTARAASEKSYAKGTGIQAVREHLARAGITGTSVSECGDQYYRVRYPLPTKPPKVSLIIPTRDRVDLLRVSVGSILEKTIYPNFEVIVVDNRSEDENTLRWLKEIASRDARVRVLPHDMPFNFSRINNAAVAMAQGELIGLVNNDIEVTDSNWLSEMVSHAVRDGVGAVGAKLYYPDGTIQHAGIILGHGGVAGHAYSRKPHDYSGQMGRAMLVQNMSAVTAACLLVKKSAYLEVGGMNEDLEIAFNDVDFCLRLLKAGYRNVWTPHAELVHHESASRGYEDTAEKHTRFNNEIKIMHDLWDDLLQSDPAYHPALRLYGEPFEPDAVRSSNSGCITVRKEQR